MLQVGDTGKFPHALSFDSLNPLCRVGKQGPCFTAIEEDEGDKRVVALELAYEAYAGAPYD